MANAMMISFACSVLRVVEQEVVALEQLFVFDPSMESPLATWEETVIITVCEREPLVPVTWTVNVPAEFAIIVSIAVPEPVMVAGLTTALSPADATTVRETGLENPLKAVIAIVEFAGEPGVSAMIEGLAKSEKCGAVDRSTFTAMLTE
jgi:hypothetical protein